MNILETINTLENSLKDFQSKNESLTNQEKPYPILKDMAYPSELDDCAGICSTEENDDRNLIEKDPDILYVVDEQEEIYVCEDCIFSYIHSNISYLNMKINHFKNSL